MKWTAAGARVPVQVRLPRELVKALDHRRLALGIPSRATLIEQLLRQALESA